MKKIFKRISIYLITTVVFINTLSMLYPNIEMHQLHALEKNLQIQV